MPYYFRLPLITQLTAPQQTALDAPGPIAISGGPGTGKSVVALWRHIRNHNLGLKQSLLLTYTKTMCNYLANSAGQEDENAKEHVDRIYLWLQQKKQNYAEIIIDEAQDVSAVSHEQLKELSESICYGADDQQMIYPDHGSTQDQLTTLYAGNLVCPLDENFRNSYEIMLFVKGVLPNKHISQNTLRGLYDDPERRTNRPRVINTRYSRERERGAIIEIIQELQSEAHNIAILVPLKKHVKFYSNLLRDSQIDFTNYDSDDGHIEEIGNIHVTTFKSSKGTEFDTVIIPDFHAMLSNINSLNVVEESDYYVALTRARRNLYLICSYLPPFLTTSEAQKQTYTHTVI